MQNVDLLQELISIKRDNEQPVYLQVAQSLIRNIRRGRLRKGLKLPGSRTLAKALGINRMTMVSAYNELQAQGWIERFPRKGTFVRHDFPDIHPQSLSEEEGFTYPQQSAFTVDEKSIIPFPISGYPDTNKLIIDSGFPDTRLAPMKQLLRHMKSITQMPVYKKYLRYGSPFGTPVFRQTLAEFMNDTRGLPISVDNIIITRGAQMGINLTASLLLKPGDHAIVGELGYFLAERTFQQKGAIINKVPVDQHGMVPEAVEDICKEKAIKLLYVIPHHHHPTTVTLTPGRRLKLLELAKRYGFAIIEDDYDYDFHYSSTPMMPMASLDHHGNVIYIGTLTKMLAPAVRIGFLIAPQNIIQAAANIRRSMDWQGDSLLELGIADLYEDGTIARHIKKSVKKYHHRRNHFCELLKTKLGNRISFSIPDGGMAVWVKFLDADLPTVSRKVLKKGLIVGDGKRYNSTEKNYNATRMGFASLTIEEQNKAIGILADCM